MAAAWSLGGQPWRAVWFADPGIQAILDRLARSRSFDVAVVEDSAMSGFRLPRRRADAADRARGSAPARRSTGIPAAPRNWPGWAFGELDWRKRPRFQRDAWRRFDRVLAFGRRDAATIAELAPEVAARVRVSPFGLALPAAGGSPSRSSPTACSSSATSPTSPTATRRSGWRGRSCRRCSRDSREARLRIVGSSAAGRDPRPRRRGGRGGRRRPRDRAPTSRRPPWSSPRCAPAAACG